MSEPVKQVILRDPKTNEILIPKIVGALGYEEDESGTLIPPYTNDADTLGGHPASDFVLAGGSAGIDATTLGGKSADQFAAAGHNHDDRYAEKEHTHDYAASNHDHSGVYATPEQLNEVKTSVAEGKALVAAAVSDKGVETAADAEFATIAANIAGIKTGGALEIIECSAIISTNGYCTLTTKDAYTLERDVRYIMLYTLYSGMGYVYANNMIVPFCYYSDGTMYGYSSLDGYSNSGSYGKQYVYITITENSNGTVSVGATISGENTSSAQPIEPIGYLIKAPMYTDLE